MFKVLIFLLLCICVINCKRNKCDDKVIIELQNGTTVSDKYTYCKDKLCVFRLCPKPNNIIMHPKGGKKRCATVEEFTKLTNKSVNVPVYNQDFSKNLTLSERKLNDFHFVAYKYWKQNFKEKKGCILNFNPNSSVQHLLENGELLLLGDIKMRIPRNEYVVEFRMRETPDGQWVGPELFTWFLAIATDTCDEPMATRELYNVIGMSTSCVFMILILVVYSTFEGLRGKYGKMLMAYIACFTVTFAVNVIHKVGLTYCWLGDFECKCISPIYYFAVMATFFWLNVMSYKIWSTFRPKNKYRTIRSREQNHEFLLAALYAFGVPLLILAGLMVLDELKLTTTTPNFEKCMNFEESSLFYYVPITVILCVNLIFFVMTSYHLWQQKKGKHDLASAESRIIRRNRNYFGLYLKLSVSTGLNWFLDVISVYVSLPTYVEYIIDTYTLFLGVILFVICVCNRSVLSLICKRFSINSRFIYQSSMNTNNSSKKSLKRSCSSEPSS
ncbi:hypothetical protein ABMA28_016717 [Loxostege sticticalis]|uniref:G-protein coupled receptors family 2 profile 2 domain-containing protein n=1 Tax=Loxostege sticticalis TaxID=481309 RepID=A0ABD0T9H8_LOXSC